MKIASRPLLSTLIFYTFAANKLCIVRLDLSDLCITFDVETGIEFQGGLHFRIAIHKKKKKRKKQRETKTHCDTSKRGNRWVQFSDLTKELLPATIIIFPSNSPK